jgi:hypothetical protein
MNVGLTGAKEGHSAETISIELQGYSRRRSVNGGHRFWEKEVRIRCNNGFCRFERSDVVDKSV